MDLNEQLAQVADILHPALDWDLPGDDHDPTIAAADAARADWLERLRLQCDREYAAAFFGTDPVTDEPLAPDSFDEADPVLVTIEHLRNEITERQDRLRALIAYARELSPPGKKYTLDTLAQAARMSVSGVRTSYTDTTVRDAARVLREGAVKRGADSDPRWR